MRAALTLWLILAGISARELSAAETFPYVAYIAGEEATVHAGPGVAYYVTDVASVGQKVEVMRQVADWLAIRPVPGSFCWMTARDVELTDQPDTAVVVAEEAVAWIGSRTEKNPDHVWQTKFNRGDHVRVLAMTRRPAARGKAAETWYRIAPPDNELRWIKATSISREAPASGGDAPSALASSDDAIPLLSPGAERAAGDTASRPRGLLAGWLDRTKPVGTGVVESKVDADVVPAQFVEAAKSPGVAGGSTSPFREVASPAARTASLDKSPARDPAALLNTSARFDDRLTDLELKLSLMAARDPNQWQFDRLRDEAEQLVAAGTTTLERGQARLVLDKVLQFEALQRKQLVTNLDPPRTAGIASVNEAKLPAATSSSGARTHAAALKIPDGVTYDGAGWLKPVYSAKRTAPPYALVDSDGKVVCFVTPAPGVNLNRYLKQPVGIFGQKSKLAELKADHLTASKVVDLTKYQ